MFFTVHSIVPMIIGAIILLFAPRIADVVRRAAQYRGLAAQKYRNILYVWPIRFMGVILLSFGFWISTSGPARGIMDNDENRIVLLESGTFCGGEITKRFYQHLAPSGWKIIYKFNVEDPVTSKERIYWGSARGPKKYYANLSDGDTATIIYNPSNPEINCEIYYFLNHPSYRNTFKKAGKLKLLDRFRDKYKFEDYSEMKWYDLARQK